MGTHWNPLAEAVLTSTHNLCFEQKYEKYQNFLTENFPFLVVKFSIYLNRLVFIMQSFSMYITKTLIRLFACTGCFESLLGVHIRRYVFSSCSSHVDSECLDQSSQFHWIQ